MMKTNNEINFLALLFLNYEDETSKYQYAIQICRLNVSKSVVDFRLFSCK